MAHFSKPAAFPPMRFPRSRWRPLVAPLAATALAAAAPMGATAQELALKFAREIEPPYRRTLPAPGASTLIAMDAPPPMENCGPFVAVAHLLHEAGVHAPRVLAQDLARGFLLLSDLGTTTYLAALDAGNAHELYLAAIDALVRFQRTSREGVLPPYDEALLRRELDLFPDWYVARHLGRALDDGQRQALDRVFGRILANNLAQPRVFVHRDYHSQIGRAHV